MFDLFIGYLFTYIQIYLLTTGARAIYMLTYLKSVRQATDSSASRYRKSDIILFIPIIGAYKTFKELGSKVLMYINSLIGIVTLVIFVTLLVGTIPAEYINMSVYVIIALLVVNYLMSVVNCYCIITTFGAYGLLKIAVIVPIVDYALSSHYIHLFISKNIDTLRGTFK